MSRKFKNSEEELKYYKDLCQFYEKILHSVPDMILVKGPKSRLVWANKAFQDMYGMTNEQLKSIIDAPFVEPDHTQQYVLDDKWVWENKKLLKIQCEPVTRHDKVVLKFETYKTPVLNQDGEVEMTVGISRDVTSKIENEEKSAYASKMASLGEMAGGIAHEINNPLTVIVGKARQSFNLLQKPPFDIEKISKGLKSIEDCGNRIAVIVNGLRKFSRESESEPLVNYKVSDIINDTLAFCQSRFKNSGVTLRLPTGNTDFEIPCRPVQISQVFLNLLNNAFDAVVGLSEAWIQVETKITNGNFELRVWDSGSGVPKEIETKIMQPFFTTKEVGKGTGLGLSVSTSIAKGHGGTLKIDRSVSDSCFVLRIPLGSAYQESNAA